MRPEELVRRAQQDVAAEVRDLDVAVRRVVNRVDPGEGADRVRDLDDLRRRSDRPDGVRRQREGHDLGPLGDERAQVLEVDPALRVEVGELHDDALVVGDLEPRRDVGVVVELRRDHLVACSPVARGGPGEREVERRHVLPEGDLVRPHAEQVGCCGARRCDHVIGDHRGDEPAAGVRVRREHVARHRLEHGVRHLRPCGAVEVGHGDVQRVEAVADRLDRHVDDLVALVVAVAHGPDATPGPSGPGPTVSVREAEAAHGGRVLRPLLRRAKRGVRRPPLGRAARERAGARLAGAEARRRRGGEGSRLTPTCRSWTSRRRYGPPARGRPRVALPSAWMCTATWTSRVPRCRPRGRPIV